MHAALLSSLPTRPWLWALSLALWPSFSKNLIESFSEKSLTLGIWSPSISDQIPHPPHWISYHSGLPSSRILSNWFSQNPPYPWCFPLGNFSSRLPLWSLPINPHFFLLCANFSLFPLLQNPHHSNLSLIKFTLSSLTSIMKKFSLTPSFKSKLQSICCR